jgi:hypothetical protein
MRPLFLLPTTSLLVLALATGGCKKDESSTAKPAPAPSPVKPDKPPEAPPPAHGSHDAAHGGFVLMDATSKHLELVLKEDGTVEVWLSDMERKVLPASTATSAAVTITPPGGAAEKITLVRDASDKMWSGKGKPATDPAAKVRLELDAPAYNGTPYQVELDLSVLKGGAAEPTHGGAAGPHGGMVQKSEGGQLELLATPAGEFKLWLLDAAGAARPAADVKARVKVAVAGYSEVALAPMGDHLMGNGGEIKADHAAAVVIVDGGGKTETARFNLHLERAGAGQGAAEKGHDGHQHKH